MTATTLSLAQPPAEGTSTTMPQRAMDALTTDATKLSFPLQIVIAIVFSTVSAVGAVWATQSQNDSKWQGVQADVRVILTQMSSTAEISRLRDDAVKAQLDNMREEIKSLKGNSQLLQLQQQQLQLELAKGKR